MRQKVFLNPAVSPYRYPIFFPQNESDLSEVPSQNLLTAEPTAVLDGVAQGCRLVFSIEKGKSPGN